MTTKGIDISKWQPTVNLQQAKSSGVQFVILRAGYGNTPTQEDKLFSQHYTNAVKAGLNIGAYWYSYAQSITDAQKEAEACIKVLAKRQFNFPIYYDIEEKGQLNKGKKFIDNIITVFCETLEKAGYYTGIYMSKSYLDTYVSNEIKSRYTVWVAQYNDKCTYTGPKDMWQYSSKGQVPGIQGNVDMDECYKDFPSIIIKGGFNNYPKQTTTQTTTSQAPTAPPVTTPTQPTLPTYTTGKVYTVQTEVKVRETPSLKGRIKKHSELTADAKAHDKDKDGALDKGTQVTCKGVANADNYIWIKGPSGWSAAYSIGDKEYYIK